MSACVALSTNALAALTKSGATNVTAGACHANNYVVAGLTRNGYTYDVSYTRSTPLWASDVLATTTPGYVGSGRSFVRKGTSTTGALGESAQAAALKQLRANPSLSVTYASGVTLNLMTKQYVWEIDYTSIGAAADTDIEIAETPGINNAPAVSGTQLSGIDVAGYANISNWAALRNKGVQFAYIKANEGTYYVNPKFASQSAGATSAGIIRGAYDFANPAADTGHTEADYFVTHGGAWRADGMTLPGALDMEWNPYGSMCYDLSPTKMTAWVRDYVNEYHAKTGVNPVIYTTNIWWNQCTDGSAFPGINVWLMNYATSAGPVPASFGGGTPLFWQIDDGNGIGYDNNRFIGTNAQLKYFATTGHL